MRRHKCGHARLGSRRKRMSGVLKTKTLYCRYVYLTKLMPVRNEIVCKQENSKLNIDKLGEKR